MPPKERGRRKVISVKVVENGSDLKLKSHEVIMNGQDLNENENILNEERINENEEIVKNKNDYKAENVNEITNNNSESTKDLNNKIVPLKRDKKKADVSVENTEVVDSIPVVAGKIESLTKESEEVKTTESNTLDENGSEVSKDNDKTEFNNKADVSDDEIKPEDKKVPLRRGRQKRAKEETSDELLQAKKKIAVKRGPKKANIPLESDKLSELKKSYEEQLSDFKKNDEESPKEIPDEQLQAEEKVPAKRGRKKANEIKSDKKEFESSNEEKSDAIQDEQIQNENKITSKRGRKKNNVPNEKLNVNSNDGKANIPLESDKLSKLEKIDEEPSENLLSEQLQAEENVPSKRGRKKANPLKPVKKKIEDDIKEKQADTVPIEQITTEDKITSKRGRKKANIPPKSDKSSDLKIIKNEESSNDTKKQKNNPSEEQTMPSKRGRKKVIKEENSETFIIKKSNEVLNEPSQDLNEKEKSNRNVKATKNTRAAKDKKQEASSQENKAPIRLKRRNETAAEDMEKNKHDFNETKILKIRLERDETIDKMCEEQTKITEVAKTTNKKAGSKRGKDNDANESEEISPKKPKNEPKSKGQSRKDKMPDVTLLDFNNNSTSPTGKPWNLKISSWNVNGIRAWLEKDGLAYIAHENPDVVALQETKCSDKMLPKEVNMAGYHAYWLAGDKDGYSGVGLLSKKEPDSVSYGIGIEEHDKEGRVITAEYEAFYLIAAYIPNAGRGLVRLNYRMEWDNDFRTYIKTLEEKKPVILCGDLNVAHEEIDLANPKGNKKNAGFTKEEREGFSTLLSDGFIDSFRHLYPDEKGAYTYWTYMMNARAKNVGWRLDYFVLSKKLTDHLCDNVMRKDVFGSDHCPITLFLCI